VTDNEEPPAEWKLTALNRALIDFELLLNPDRHGNFFRSVETIEGLYNEQKRLQQKMMSLQLITFFGACLVLLGPLPPGAKFSMLGLEAPISIIPQQILALVTAGAYSMFMTLFASTVVLTQMLRLILEKESIDAWQFFSGRFDASTLWAALIAPKIVGYKSPKRHVIAASVILIVSALTMLAHAIVVATSSVLALWSAWNSTNWFLIIVGAFSAGITIFSLVALVFLVGFKLPYRIQEDEVANET
jgi:hypothetical protein